MRDFIFHRIAELKIEAKNIKFSFPIFSSLNICHKIKSFFDGSERTKDQMNSISDSNRSSILNRNGGLNHGEHAKKIAQLLLSPTSLILSENENNSNLNNRRQSTLSETTVSAVRWKFSLFVFPIFASFSF